MGNLFSRRKFLGTAGAATVIPRLWPLSNAFEYDAIEPGEQKASSDKSTSRIVDIHVHFDEKKPNYIDDFLKLSDRLNLTACMLTPFANRYGWIVLFHTGIVLRKKFDEPEDVASGRMRPIHLEEIARRWPKITVLGAHCGNPEYEWAAE